MRAGYNYNVTNTFTSVLASKFGDKNACSHSISTQIVTDITGAITQAVLYAPFGEVISEYNAYWMLDTIPRYLFSGKELDEESGMYYFEARYYAPPTFISRDPLFEKYFWMSPYAYCANNPVKYIDPDGRKLKPTQAFLNSPYSTVYQRLLLNKKYMEIIEKYANSTVNHINYDIKDKSLSDPKHAAETTMSWKTTTNTLNGKVTGKYITYNSQQNYFNVGLTQDGYSLTEIAKARNIIHEGIHSYIGGKGMKESNDGHEVFMNYHTMLFDALVEYNNTNNLGYTNEQLIDLSYSGIPQENSQFISYIQGFANKNKTSYETELDAFTSRVSKMIWKKSDNE